MIDKHAAARLWWAGMAALLALSTATMATMPATASPAGAVNVSGRFASYYAQHEGLRVLGPAITGLLFVQGYPSQYFEKGRIEDHRGENGNSAWAFAYGLLTPELMQYAPEKAVSGTSLNYADLRAASEPRLRVAPPAGFTSGTAAVDGGGRFVPFDAALGRTNGYIVPAQFWTYINRADLFPGGWLHDIGLPLTGELKAQVSKNGETRAITLQAFERAVLSYDPKNPAGWQVERGNIGFDALGVAAKVGTSEVGQVRIPTAGERVTLPLHILAHVATPSREIVAALTWDDGIVLTGTLPVLRDDDAGVVIGSIDWLTEGPPPQPATKSATLRLLDTSTDGRTLAEQKVTVLPFDDPDTTQIKVFWAGTENAEAVTQVIPRTQGVGAAAIEELLWGPGPRVIAFPDFTTALPLPSEVLTRRGQNPEWGPRVMLRGLKIENGVATVDFSREIMAYGGGSARVGMMTSQIEMTLKQFPAVKSVRILVEGAPPEGGSFQP